MEENNAHEDFPATCEAAPVEAEPAKKPSRKKAAVKEEPKAEPAKRYVMRCNVTHGRPSGERLILKKGEVVKGLSDGEIKTFLENGFIEFK